MTTKYSFIILAGGFGTSFQVSYPSVPKSLIPLGHNPSICILLETLLDLQNLLDTIYVIVFDRHLESFKKEINRWFMNKEIIKIISVPDTEGTATSVQHFLDTHPCKNEDLIILYSNMPLIHRSTLKDFMFQCAQENSVANILVSKIKNNKDYEKAIIVEDKATKIVSFLDMDCSSEYCFLNTLFIKKTLLENLLPLIEPNPLTTEFEINDIVSLLPEGSDFYVLNPYQANKECILVKKTEDKNFAEEVYLEHRNSHFIHQCYGLWKKCDTFENRLNYIESILDKNNMK